VGAESTSGGAEEKMERSLKWVEQKEFRRFGCTACGWSHPNPSLRDDPATLDATVLGYIKRAFTAHLCDHYPAPKCAPAKPTDLTGKILIVPSQPLRSWFFRLTQRPRTRRAVASGYRPATAR
jgi:hypothetical protein